MKPGLRDIDVVALAFCSGATDAIGFAALGGAFTSVMTGNLVLVGIGVAEADSALVVHAGSAIISFILGAAVGARVAGSPQQEDDVWPAAVSRALALEAILLAAFAAMWWMSDGRPPPQLTAVMLPLNAVALGMQSSAVQRFGTTGLSTTYLTGTLTSIVIKLVTGRRTADVIHPISIIAGLVAGAIVSVCVLTTYRHAAPLTQLVPLVLVLATTAPRLFRLWRASPR